MRDEASSPGEVDFAVSYLSDDVWVSGPSDGVLALPFSAVQSLVAQTEPFVLRIHRPLVTMHLAKDRKSAVDPSRPCDAISIGIGFTASAVSAGGQVPPDPPPKCP